MSARLERERCRRLAASVTLVVALLLSCSLGDSDGGIAAAPVFVLVMVVCTATVILTRGLGWRWGLGLGLLAGLAISAALAAQLAATGAGLTLFVGLASLILCLLGGVAGAAHATRSQYGPGSGSSRSSSSQKPSSRSKTPAGRASIYDLANLTEEFCIWIESSAGRQCCAETHDWSGFDQFVRTALQQHLRAGNVRIYELSADGLWLEPLTRPKTGAAPRLSASEGAIGRALSSGQAMVLEDALELAACEAGGSRSPASKPAWRAIRPESAGLVHSTPRWLLPLRAGTRTEVLVTVARVDVPRSEEQRIARAVRAQLQLFWRQLSVLRTLSRHLRTDRQTGMLERGELLNRLDDVINEAIQKPEPVTVLALALEGLRRLDDVGCWRQRDLLVQELGRALRAKIRADDVVGRFSDDRFIVVLRGLDATLATRVAEKLLQTVRTEAIHTVGQPANEQASGEWALKLRGGLAGTGAVHGGLRPFATFDGQTPAPETPAAGGETGQRALQRALGLVEYARRQRIELATDLMAGVPDSLARDSRPLSPGEPADAPAPATSAGEHAAATSPDIQEYDGVST